ncbi:MAG: universal stress protein [Rhizobiaceae bacterium]|nr:universal stress protein [Rhizobiaceae bacterium]
MYDSILVPVDLNQESSWKKALPVAIDLAKINGGALHILTVIPDFGMAVVGSFFPADYAKNMLAKVETDLATFVADNIPAGVTVTSDVKQGSIYKEILRAADKLDSSVIVMSSHGPETKDYLLGPNAARVVRHAIQSVFVVRDN